MKLGDKILNATPEEKILIKDIMSTFFRLINEKKFDEARKFLAHNKKKYEQHSR